MNSGWTNIELQQLWAEGIDVNRPLPQKPRQPMGLSNCHSFMPLREHFKYPAPTRFSSGAQLVAVYLTPEHLTPALKRFWGGALSSIGQSITGDRLTRMDAIAHWRLNLLIGKSGLSTPESVIRFWLEHRSMVQTTSAEQQVLHWYMFGEPWAARWHAHREESGAMRRAPIWGAIYAGMPQQAAAAAYRDARIAHVGWAVWASTVVAYGTAEMISKGATPATALLNALTYVEPPNQMGVQALIANMNAAHTDTWRFWTQLIDTEFNGYPRHHSLPNLLLILGALYWNANDWMKMQESLEEAGWDACGNQLVAGALAGRSVASNSGVGPLVEKLVDRTVVAHRRGSEIHRGESGN